MQALCDLASPVHGALTRTFALRGVSQPIAPPASEIAPAVDLPASPAASQAAEPLPSAAEPGRRIDEVDELINVDRRAVAVRRPVDQAHAVVLRSQRDRARLLSRSRRAIQAALPKEAIISSDIGNNCAIGNAYPTFEQGRKYLAPGLFGPCGYGFPAIIGAKIGCPDVPVVGFAGDGAFGISMNEMSSIGRKEWPGITMVIFRNYQWGAEKRNSILWYDDNFVGTELDPHLSYAKVAKACGLEGVQVKTQAELTAALKEACAAQKKRVTTFIEVILNQELGEPFRRDAMKKPVVVAGIDRKDMRPQQGSV
jgi:thiamine pyrophosphate-dependent acetolactate synthase large subunit-like protein